MNKDKIAKVNESEILISNNKIQQLEKELTDNNNKLSDSVLQNFLLNGKIKDLKNELEDTNYQQEVIDKDLENEVKNLKIIINKNNKIIEEYKNEMKSKENSVQNLTNSI